MKTEHCLAGIAPTLEVKTGEIWGVGVHAYTRYVKIRYLWHPMRWHCNTKDREAYVLIVRDTTELASRKVNGLLRTNVRMLLPVLEHMLK